MTSLNTPSTTHAHRGSHCPVSGKHGYCPAQAGDSRSPCPALNAMANHGYLPRNGHNISVFRLIKGLRACYGLSMPLSVLLAAGSFYLLKRVTPVSLYHIGKHDAIEHNASLVHEDCKEHQKYASIDVVPRLVEVLTHEDFQDSTDDSSQSSESSSSHILDVQTLAKFRVEREKECLPVDGVHAEIARGEMAIVFGMWGEKNGSHYGIPKAWLRDWFHHGRLPKDWKPTHKQGLLDTMHRSKEIKKMMEELKKSSTSTLAADTPKGS